MATFETVLKKYLDTFKDQEMYFVDDIRNLELFKDNAANTTAESIRMKVSTVNSELRANNITEEMIAHILKLNIDSRLKKGDLTLVEDIAKLQSKGREYNMLHFASVYCNLHDPETFPIYSDQHFAFYRNYIKAFKLPIDPGNLATYPVFCSVLNDLIKRLGLKGKMNYLHIRKFGWLYAENVLNESGASIA
jgi:hypothetical protein